MRPMKKNTRSTQKHTTRKRKSAVKSAPKMKSKGDADRGLYLRFKDMASKEKVRKAATAANMSMNRYIEAAAMDWAKAGKRPQPIAIAEKQEHAAIPA